MADDVGLTLIYLFELVCSHLDVFMCIHSLLSVLSHKPVLMADPLETLAVQSLLQRADLKKGPEWVGF